MALDYLYKRATHADVMRAKEITRLTALKLVLVHEQRQAAQRADRVDAALASDHARDLRRLAVVESRLANMDGAILDVAAANRLGVRFFAASFVMTVVAGAAVIQNLTPPVVFEGLAATTIFIAVVWLVVLIENTARLSATR